jgi:uncharacterized DUF497 family protein
MLFEWDAAKDRSNRKKHTGIDFETASRVFADSGSRSRIERVVGDETRWQTIGLVGGELLLVAHTWEEHDGEEIVRIISARKANKHEGRRYFQQADE